MGASWGLIARGRESIPFALEMLSSRNPDIREDGAGVLAEIGGNDQVVDALLQALRAEDQHQPRDVMIDALGRMKNRRAVPFLADTVRAPATDDDTRLVAAEALGRIVGRRFGREPDPAAAARAWLDEHGL